MDRLPPSLPNPTPRSSFADYKDDGRTWITLATGEYYPDVLKEALVLYEPVLVLFSKYLRESESSTRLLLRIAEEQSIWMRIQLARVFRKYVSPETPVEMLKKKSKAQQICDQFGTGFRPIHIVQAAFDSRPLPDEALCALLWEYKDRGKKGYDITSRFFSLFRQQFPSLVIKGPERAGRDIRMGEVFADYPRPTRPVDFVIYDESGSKCWQSAWPATIRIAVAHRKMIALVAILAVPMKFSVTLRGMASEPKSCL